MGTLGNGLPDLPPEWGQVVIPDDPAELAEEAEKIRGELRREARRYRRDQWRARWRHRLHLPERIDDPEQPSMLLPVLVLAIAVLITLMSLVLIAWPGLTQPAPNKIDPGPSIIQPTDVVHSGGGGRSAPASSAPRPSGGTPEPGRPPS